jgi:hypothetical protein
MYLINSCSTNPFVAGLGLYVRLREYIDFRNISASEVIALIEDSSSIL